MRAPLLGDVVAAARALLAVGERERGARLDALFAEADAAADHWMGSGRAHPIHGDGSLMAAALARGAVPEPALSDPSYRACLVLVLTRIGQGAGSPRDTAGAMTNRRPPLSS